MVQIKSVGAIGAGQMGTGIAHVVALGGYDVLLHDVSAERLDAGMGLIARNMTRQVTRGIITQDAMDAGLARITSAPELQPAQRFVYARLGQRQLRIDWEVERKGAWVVGDTLTCKRR